MRQGRTPVGHPVDVASGAVYVHREDCRIPGKIELAWQRYYDTTLAAAPSASAALGRGWTNRYFATLTTRGPEVEFKAAHGGLEIFVDSHDVLKRGGVLRRPGAFLELARLDGRYVVTHWEVETARVERYVFVPGRDGESWPLAALEDQTGQGLDISYDRAGRIAAIRQRLEQRTLAVDYGGGDRVASLTLTVGDRRHTIGRFEYDREGRLIAAYDALGFADRYEYDTASRLVRESLKDGSVYTFAYDFRGRCIRTSGLDHFDQKALRFFDAIRWTEVTNSVGDVTRYCWNAHGQVTEEVDALGGRWLTEYDEHGRIVKRIDPLGGATAYKYDDRGNRSELTDPLGHTYSLTFNESHLATTLTTPAGATWTREYDFSNRLIATQDPAGGRWRIEYDSHGNALAITNPSGRVRRQAYSTHGVLVGGTDWRGQTSRYVFDDFGRLTARTDPLHRTTRFEYDLRGNLTECELPDGSRTVCRYDSGARMTRFTNANGATTTSRYGAGGRLLERTDSAGGTVRFTWGTEPRRLEQVQNELGEVYEFAYDAAGRVVRERRFDGRTYAFRYDAAGRCIARTNGADETVVLRRDAAGRTIERILPDGTSATYDYDADGRLVAAVNGDSDVRFERNQSTRVVRELQGNDFVESQFDVLGNVIGSTTSRGHRSEFVLDASGSPAQLTTSEGWSMRFERDASGFEVARQLSGRMRIEQDFDSIGRLTKQRVGWDYRTDGDARERVDSPALVRREYSYDRSGAVTAIVDARAGDVAYGVDAGGALLHARSNGTSEHFAYDPAGNLIAIRTASGEESLEYAPGHRLVRKGATTYAYDANGRLVKKVEADGAAAREWHFTWDALDQLRTVRTPEGERWDYRYDALGRRVAKTGPDTDVRFIWDGNVIVHEVTTAGPTSTWLFEPRRFTPLATRQNGRWYAIITDHLGTPREMLDDRGDIAWTAVYKAWGGIDRQFRADVDCPVRFPGQWSDAETGLHFSRFRFYDPTTGRFISTDPVGWRGNLNAYLYVRNPIVWTDPFGLQAEPGCGGTTDEGEERTPLYRAVTPEELADIQSTGTFRPSPTGSEGKYFSTTPEGATSYADQAVRGFGDAPYTMVSTSIPSSAITPDMSPPGGIVDRNVPAVVVPNGQLDQLSPPVIVGPIPPPSG